MSAVGVDTSVAVPLLLTNHEAHAVVARWSAGRRLALCGHAHPETYSILTRLPAGLRVTATDAARLLNERFERPLVLSAATAASITDLLSSKGIVGGAVYDALVGVVAAEHEVELATRDERALATYGALGVRVARVT